MFRGAIIRSNCSSICTAGGQVKLANPRQTFKQQAASTNKASVRLDGNLGVRKDNNNLNSRYKRPIIQLRQAQHGGHATFSTQGRSDSCSVAMPPSPGMNLPYLVNLVLQKLLNQLSSANHVRACTSDLTVICMHLNATCHERELRRTGLRTPP